MACLCIDVGTSIIKAVAFDDREREPVVVRQDSTVLRPRPGCSEQDMDAVWNAVAQTIRRVLAELAEPVKFLALTAQGHGAWLVNSAGQPTGPAILWNDARATAIIERWREADSLPIWQRMAGGAG